MMSIKWGVVFAHNPLLGAAMCLQYPLFRRRLKKVGFPILDHTSRKIGTEWMWCHRVGFDLFIVYNIPEVTDQAGLGDLVSAGWSADGWLFIECRVRNIVRA